MEIKKHPNPSHNEAFCQSCSTVVTPTIMDVGEGAGEFWGRLYVDTDLVAACPVCEGTMFLDIKTREPIEITVEGY